jgi:gamma-tubulin complex component 3
MVGRFAEELLTPVTRPFYDMLRHWIYDGELSDPYHEFFVLERDPNEVKEGEDPRNRTSATSVWEDKYDLNTNMIPSIMTEDFAQKVFLIGKSLNFIRYSCGDSAWVEQYSKAASKELRYGDTATLEAWIDEAYKTTMARLMHLMTDKFHLFEHLKALKDYIFLGQGDFIALLMESLSANLDRPAGAQYRHTLTAQLEHAIRGSNAQYDSPEVLRRLDARMLQLSHGDIGWDCFTLEYKVDAPVDVVVTPWANRQYLKMFNFLWRVKRVEFVLATTWRKCMTGARGVLQAGDQTVAETWKSTRGEIAAMIHFIGQLQYYILFEVIESSWDDLQKAVHAEGCTLNELIAAHLKYLHQITHKGLLGGKESKSSNHMKTMGELMSLMLHYRNSVDGLYSWSVADFSRRQDSELRGGSQETESAENDSVFTELKTRLSDLGHQFRKKVATLLGDLAYQPDTDMRFLGVVMNFNDFYHPVRPVRDKAPTTARKK